MPASMRTISTIKVLHTCNVATAQFDAVCWLLPLPINVFTVFNSFYTLVSVCVCVYCKITWNHVQGGLKVVTDIILFILIHAHVPNFGQCYHAVTFSIAPLTTTTADIFLRQPFIREQVHETYRQTSISQCIGPDLGEREQLACPQIKHVRMHRHRRRGE